MGSTRRARQVSKSPAKSSGRSGSRSRGKKRSKGPVVSASYNPGSLEKEVKMPATKGVADSSSGKKIVLAVDESQEKRKRSWRRRVFYSWVLFWSFLLQMTVLKQLGCVLCVFATATLCCHAGSHRHAALLAIPSAQRRSCRSRSRCRAWRAKDQVARSR